MDYFDLHCDTPYECYFKKQSFSQNRLSVSAEKGAIFGKWHQTMAIWIPDDCKEPYVLYKAVMSDIKKKLVDKPDNLKVTLAVENGAVIGNDLSLLEELKRDGVELLTLTWNGENAIAGGAKSNMGLTDFGREAIAELNRLNMYCDLSHLNEKSFYKALELAKLPLATHSNCRAVCNNPRNLTDCQLKALAEKGGIVGLCFYPEFSLKNVFDGIYKNVLHLLELGLENSIAIGSDFDGAEMSPELVCISQVPDLYRYLCKKGIPSGILNKIFYENAKKYFETFDKGKYL